MFKSEKFFENNFNLLRLINYFVSEYIASVSNNPNFMRDFYQCEDFKRYFYANASNIILKIKALNKNVVDFSETDIFNLQKDIFSQTINTFGILIMAQAQTVYNSFLQNLKDESFRKNFLKGFKEEIKKVDINWTKEEALNNFTDQEIFQGVVIPTLVENLVKQFAGYKISKKETLEKISLKSNVSNICLKNELTEVIVLEEVINFVLTSSRVYNGFIAIHLNNVDSAEKNRILKEFESINEFNATNLFFLFLDLLNFEFDEYFKMIFMLKEIQFYLYKDLKSEQVFSPYWIVMKKDYFQADFEGFISVNEFLLQEFMKKNINSENIKEIVEKIIRHTIKTLEKESDNTISLKGANNEN